LKIKQFNICTQFDNFDLTKFGSVKFIKFVLTLSFTVFKDFLTNHPRKYL
jgi:hypothetical protein